MAWGVSRKPGRFSDGGCLDFQIETPDFKSFVGLTNMFETQKISTPSHPPAPQVRAPLTLIRNCGRIHRNYAATAAEEIAGGRSS
eukprot:9502955-Pyramimonas_sp.AAC.1